ncbi:hypothetical protein ACFQ3N_14725 [Virgibacillus byunsanensis]|uniref:Uncharacterized protein n=1 Tax=Virgibacillus byunsanensis TaxID=570945 RepID=A0ABW3LQL7_9BACI
MSAITVKEAMKFFYSYGLKWDEKLVQEWMNDPHTKITSNQACEDDLHRFNDWCKWKDTAYEEGIDDQTKIANLLEEINDLKSEISSLKTEQEDLKEQLGIMPF